MQISLSTCRALALMLGTAVTLPAPAQQPATPPAASASAAKPALTVNIARPAQGSLPMRLAANGNIAAWQEASVGSEANGLRLADVRVNVGDYVQRGQVLAVFAAESVAADVAQARAGVAEAQAQAADAAANAQRARAFEANGMMSKQQISLLLTGEQTAAARLESAKAMLTVQQIRLKNTQILAPDSGIISARTATVGAVVGAGTELFRLIRQARLEWRGEVVSGELARIKPGTAVTVTAASGTKLEGKVRTVAPTVDPVTRNALVYVDLVTTPATAATAKAGMFARGEFELGSSSALTVPQQAVVVRDGFSYVSRIGADNRVAQIKVQTGRVVGDQIEIQSGVKPEDKLVASGGSFLSEGDLVRVVEKSTPALVKPTQAASK